MKIFAMLKNERGGKKSTGDNTRILVELSYGQKVVGEIGLYVIKSEGQELGYRVVWQTPSGEHKVIQQEEKAKSKKANEAYGCIYDHDHRNGSKCEYHSL